MEGDYIKNECISNWVDTYEKLLLRRSAIFLQANLHTYEPWIMQLLRIDDFHPCIFASQQISHCVRFW